MSIRKCIVNSTIKWFFTTCMLLYVTTCLFSQTESAKIDWNPGSLDNAPYLLGHFDDRFIYNQKNKNEWNITFIEKGNEEVGSSLLMAPCDDCFISSHYTVSTSAGNFFLSAAFDENQEKLSLYNFKQKESVIDKGEMFHDQKLELCGRTKGQNNPAIQRKSFSQDYPIGEWEVSPDKSIVGYYNILANDLIHKEKKVLVAAFDQDLKKKWEKTIVLGDKKEKNHLVDIFVSNDGKIFALIKHKSSDSSIPANSFGYSYKILVVSNTDTENIVVNLNEDRIIYNASFVKGLKNGKVTVGGYYGKAKGFITGNFVYEAGLNNSKSNYNCNLFSKISLDTHPKKYKKVKNNSFRNHEFYMIDVVGFENGNVLFVGEFNWIDVGAPGGQSAEFWGDILTTVIDAQGNLMEANFIRKNYQTNSNKYDSILKRDEDHAYIAFVDFKKKIERKERDISKGGGYFDLVVLDPGGKIKFNNTINVNRENKIRVTSSFLWLSDDLLIFQGRSTSKKNYVGTIPLSALNL